MREKRQVYKVDFVQLDKTHRDASALFWREPSKGDQYTYTEYAKPTQSSITRLTTTIRRMTHQRRARLLPWWDCLGWSADIDNNGGGYQ